MRSSSRFGGLEAILTDAGSPCKIKMQLQRQRPEGQGRPVGSQRWSMCVLFLVCVSVFHAAVRGVFLILSYTLLVLLD